MKSREIESRVYKTLAKIESGLFGDSKSVGDGVQEIRIHFGPGYRIYYGYDGIDWIIILAGGDKGSQSKDIQKAKEYWAEYKNKKKTGFRKALKKEKDDA